MQLSLYFFRQFIPSFMFGSVLFLFVLILDRLFDLVDLIFNKGVQALTVGKLFLLFVPTVLPLTFPMAIVLASLVAFGRISEENELTAVQAAGIPAYKVLWLPPLFALIISIFMVPFNTRIAPWSNRVFQNIYQEIISAEPLINITPRNFFSIKNLKIFAESVNKKTNQLQGVFVYQMAEDSRPAQRTFAHSGVIETDSQIFKLKLFDGQIERFDSFQPDTMVHTTFKSYEITVPLNFGNTSKNQRFRNIPSKELRELILELQSKGFTTHPLQAEYSMRYAMAFATFCLAMVALPLATVLKRGGRSFGFGVTIMVIFAYYLILILGLTLAEKGILPSHLALWIGNIISLIFGTYLFVRLHKK